MSDPVLEARRALLEKLGLDHPPARFDEALTHPSWTNENRSSLSPDNQRLEFLGDGVLDLCVSELLLEKMPDADEGALSRAYIALVNTEALARWARANAVGPALRLGKGAIAERSAERANVLADAMEAILAAVYLDGGLDAARDVTRTIIGDGLDRIDELTARDPKSELQEVLQAEGGAPPSYQVRSIEGPPNARIYFVEAVIDGQVVAEGHGRSKKQAEQAAAAVVLEDRKRAQAEVAGAEPSP